jgi:hypothetical protein
MSDVPSSKPGVEARLQLGPCQRPVVVGIEGSEQRVRSSHVVRSLRP